MSAISPGSAQSTARALAALLASGVFAAGLAACTPHTDRGNALYAEHRYVEAAEVFERTEQRLSAADPDEQAEYGLYRGLTLLELGDFTRAREWLAFARQVDTKQPGALDADQKALLDAGWEEIDRAEAERPLPREEGAVATGPVDVPPAARGGNGRRFVPRGTVTR